jgi:hypothetical protein
MQMCDLAFWSNNFLLLYFTNRKHYTSLFCTNDFKDLIRDRFQFLQLSRADKAGNWLATTFQVKRSPYYTIIDPSCGEFVAICYGEVSLSELGAWLSDFLATAPRFRLGQTVFTELIEKTQKLKTRTAFATGAKIRVNFVNGNGEERVMYVNRIAPLQVAFDKYCSEARIDISAHYFIFRGLQLPGNMSGAQLGLRNGSVVQVHALEEKFSKEQIVIAVVTVAGDQSTFHVTRSQKVGSFLKSYCELSGLKQQQMRFTFNNDVIFEELTFGEHNIRSGGLIYAHLKPYQSRPEHLYRMRNMEFALEPNDVAVAAQNLPYAHNQEAQPRHGLPTMFPGNPYIAPWALPQQQQKGVHCQNKGNEHTAASIWEAFDVPS